MKLRLVLTSSQLEVHLSEAAAMVLNAWVESASKSTTQSPWTYLFEHFGLPSMEGAAYLRYWGEQGHPPELPVICVEPAYLNIGIEQMTLTDAIQQQQLDVSQAIRIVDTLNAHFVADGWQITVGQTGGWYLSLEGFLPIQTRPWFEMVGQDIREALPKGDTAYWHHRLNEAQMVLHQLGETTVSGIPVNTLWFWGEGMPPKVHIAPFNACSDIPLVKGLAMHAGVELCRADFDKTQPILVVDDADNPSARIETIWARWEDGEIDELELVLLGQCFTIKRKRRWR